VTIVCLCDRCEFCVGFRGLLVVLPGDAPPAAPKLLQHILDLPLEIGRCQPRAVDQPDASDLRQIGGERRKQPRFRAIQLRVDLPHIELFARQLDFAVGRQPQQEKVAPLYQPLATS